MDKVWAKYCVLSAAGAKIADANPNDIVFATKHTKLYAVTLSAKDNQKLSKLISKRFER